MVLSRLAAVLYYVLLARYFLSVLVYAGVSLFILVGPFVCLVVCVIYVYNLALCHLTEFRTGTKDQVTNYLDDFLFIALTLMGCNAQINPFLELCAEIKLPVSLEKTEWANTLTIFLGILLDGISHTLGIPIDKRNRAINMLQEMLHKKKVTIKQLQTLCRFLNFLGKAILPGCTFTRCMYAKYSGLVKTTRQEMEWSGLKLQNLKALKQDHHIRLDREFKIDCAVWLKFLSENFAESVNRPMVDLLDKSTTSEEIASYSNSSTSKRLGFGCILNMQWIQGFWGSDFVTKNKPSIEFLELFALVAGILSWENKPQLNNRRITVFCDNTAVVEMINSITSSCGKCLQLL